MVLQSKGDKIDCLIHGVGKIVTFYREKLVTVLYLMQNARSYSIKIITIEVVPLSYQKKMFMNIFGNISQLSKDEKNILRIFLVRDDVNKVNRHIKRLEKGM